jgi:hypothetical protein
MLKKFFDWTPSDIAHWEKIRQKGLAYFILWYGVKLFGCGLFILLGTIVIIVWVRAVLETHVMNIAGLGLELLFSAAMCILGGVVNSLLTWAMEEIIYQKMMRLKIIK